jgi:hypothetical protein
MVPVWGGRAAPPVKAAISVNPAADASVPVWAAALARSTTGASAPISAAATAPLGVRGCSLRRLLPRYLHHQLELVVSVVVGKNRVAGATGAQSLKLCRHRTCCIRRRCCFYFCPCCCQFHHRRPCRRRCSLCRRSLAFLCRQPQPLLPVLRARGDQALRLSFRHDALVGGCYMRKRLPQTSCCSSVQERRDKQGQPVFLLPAEDRGRRGKGMSRRCLCCRIERLRYQMLGIELLLSSRERMTLGVEVIF